MKILMLNYEFPPLGGGAGRATLNIARELVKSGNEVDILTSSYEKKATDEVVDGINIYRVFSKRKGIHECGFLGMLSYVIFGFFKFRKLVKNKKYDVIHAFFSIPTGIITFLGKKIYGLNYIVSLRGSDVPDYDQYEFNVMHKFLKPLNRRIWKNAHSVVVLSKNLAEIASKTEPKLHYKVIYNGIDMSVFRPMNVKKTDECIQLICVSRLLKRKGIQYLLYALSKLRYPNLKLLIVGTGNYGEELRRLTSKLDLSERVSFHNYCKNEDLPELYNRSDIFVLPSLTESFGLVFLEAMACGLPIIATRTGGIPEIVENGENGILVEPGEIDELKNALDRLISDKELRQKMSRNNLLRVREFSWEKIANQYLEEYKNVCNPHFPAKN